jgi:hypothetical protein
MDLGKKGVFCFTDALNPAQLIELAQRTEHNWAIPPCGIRRRWVMSTSDPRS